MTNTHTITGDRVPPAWIAKSWGLPHHQIVAFLSSRGIEPLQTMPHGRGVLRFYSDEVLNLRDAFIAFRDAEAAKRLAATVPRRRGSPADLVERMARIEETLARIERLLRAQ